MYRGEIWLIQMNPTIGAEIGKTRPGVVVNDDTIGKLPLKVIVPLTAWKDRYLTVPWMVRLDPDKDNNLAKSSAVDTFQIRSLAQERFKRKLGKLSDAKMEEIAEALAIVLSIP